MHHCRSCFRLCPGNPGANSNFDTNPDPDINVGINTDPHANTAPYANTNVNADPHADSDANSFLGSEALHARGTGDRLGSVARHVRLH